MTILKVINVTGAIIGQQAEMYANFWNEAHITRSERHSTDFVRDERISCREERAAQQDFYEQEEGPLYGSGLAD